MQHEPGEKCARTRAKRPKRAAVRTSYSPPYTSAVLHFHFGKIRVTDFARKGPFFRILLGVSLYIEFPTGDASQQLGSGLSDFWLNWIAQKSLSDKTRVNGNLGYLFAGNSSTGVLGIETTRGHVFTGGLSILHDFTSRLTLGGEVYGGFTQNGNLGRSQLQVLVGGQYRVRRGLNFTFGTLGGKFVGSPRIGIQFGFAVDFPDALH